MAPSFHSIQYLLLLVLRNTMIDEKISVAPMLEWTDPHFRMLMRGITRRSVLYTEMLVDEAVVYTHPSALDFMIGKGIEEDPSVIQLGGHDPTMLANAAEKCEAYAKDSYAEFNLNCGCPSQRVAKKCFGAQLMLQPTLVQEIVKTIQRRVSTPITIKCRVGIDEQDSYADLCHFIEETCLRTGVKKVILHARKAITGLNTKQNRAVPPLHPTLAHQLVKDYPDLTFVLNGGIQDVVDGSNHIEPKTWTFPFNPLDPYHSTYWTVLGKRVLDTSTPSSSSIVSAPNVEDEILASGLQLPGVHGVMLGRAVYNNPLVLAQADSRVYGKRDPCLTRRQILERYMDYCDYMQSEQGPARLVSGHDKKEPRVSKITCSILLNAMRNVINHVKHVNKYRQQLNDIYIEEVNRLGGKDVANPSARLVIEGAMEALDEEELDAPLGDVEFYPNDL
eukprot:scaffold11566_cov156-Ochromonas_danica.AAC.2